jgi:hypothetical protein
MRIDHGRWRCTWCGTFLDEVPLEARPHTELRAAGGQSNVRVVIVGGEEVHRCSPNNGGNSTDDS